MESFGISYVGFVLIDIVGGVLVLGAILAYGTHMWRKRPCDPALKEVSDAATRQMYRGPSTGS